MSTPNPAALGMHKGDLPKIQGFLTKAKADFHKHSSELDGQIQGLMGRGYSGQGAIALKRLQDAWTHKHKMIVNTINQFEQALGATDKWTMSTDQQVADQAASRMSKLDV